MDLQRTWQHLQMHYFHVPNARAAADCLPDASPAANEEFCKLLKYISISRSRLFLAVSVRGFCCSTALPATESTCGAALCQTHRGPQTTPSPSSVRSFAASMLLPT